MPPGNRIKPRVFFDADVIMAGVTSSTDFAASLILIRLSEINVIEAICSEQVVTEVQETLKIKIPEAVKYFLSLVEHSIKITPDPLSGEIEPMKKFANDLYIPTLAVAVREKCNWLATFNEQQYLPGHPDILVARPDDLVSRLRGQFAWQGS